MERVGTKNYDVGNHLHQKLEAQLANAVKSFFSPAQISFKFGIETKQIKNSQFQRNKLCLSS